LLANALFVVRLRGSRGKIRWVWESTKPGQHDAPAKVKLTRTPRHLKALDSAARADGRDAVFGASIKRHPE